MRFAERWLFGNRQKKLTRCAVTLLCTLNAFQWVFGFNGVYDAFTFMASCYVDTLHCKFTYDGRDWLIQFWKGSYGGIATTGGEIGVYNKPAGCPVEHYFSAERKDWLGMGFIVYNGGKELFTRPFDRYWWITGFQPGYLPAFYAKPRANCVLTAMLQLKDAEMARLVAECLKAKGFAPLKKTPGLEQPECYSLQGDMVYLSWQNVTESCY